MPISEDEYERCSVNEATSTMSKAELRKTHKPIMEKRRRARINHCLNEIKTLILEAMKKDPARHSKLEKADILEMAVKHLQTVQRQQLAIAMAADPTVLRKFKTGFNECADEVTSYIAQIDGPESGLKHNISSHLTKCISGIEQIAQYSFPGLGSVSFMPNNQNLFGASLPDKSEGEPLGDQNNNPRVKIPQGIQLIPSRLPSGEIAFLVPNSRNLQCFSNIRESPGNAVQAKQDFRQVQRPSAFVSVIPNCTTTHCQDGVLKTLSPPLSPTSSSNSQSDDVIIVGEHFPKSPSPARGFRPVNPALHKSYQSAFVSTANVSGPRSYNPEQGAELKSIRYPIHKYSSPKKMAEPLSIITNHSERFKQAQVVEDSARYEENIPHGIKRKYREHQGLLAVATDEFLYPAKVPKTSKDTYAMQQRNFDVLSSEASSDEKDDDSQPSTSANTSTDRGNSGSSGDMWRPW